MRTPKKASSLRSPDHDVDPTVDATISRVLAQPPSVAIPDDFAARVALQVACQPQLRARLWLGWGPRLALASGALLTVAMFILAPHAAPSFTNARFDAELLLSIELSCLALFSRRLLQD